MNHNLHKSTWNKIAVFFNSSYKRFTPRFEKEKEQQAKIAKVEQDALDLLWDKSDLTWEQLIQQYRPANQKIVQTFYYHLSRKYQNTPLILKKKWEYNLQKFVQLIDYLLSNEQHCDLNKLAELNKIIDNFKGHSSRTFLFLRQFPLYLDAKNAELILNSFGYQTILEYGDYYAIKNLGIKLKIYLDVTPQKIQEQVAKNIVEQLGETEANLSYQLDLLQDEVNFLRNEIELIKTTAMQEANYELAKSLENQNFPVLTQILTLKERLDKTLAEKVPLSDKDTLIFSIVLENILKAIKSLGIVPFPANVNIEFSITEEELGKYNYTKGSSFNKNSKLVRCTSQGWQMGERIIASASVEEIINPSDCLD